MAEAVAAGCEVVEYSPNQVKQAVAGDGGADKEQVERMVQTLLGIATPLRPVDAADAVALALCHLAHAPLHSGCPPGEAPARLQVADPTRRGWPGDRVAAGAARCSTGAPARCWSRWAASATVVDRRAHHGGGRSATSATRSSCWVHHHLREDADTLYGFATRDERVTFEALLGAHGVGPGAGAGDPVGPHAGGAGPDPGRGRRRRAVPGARASGKKTAARLLVELKSRLARSRGRPPRRRRSRTRRQRRRRRPPPSVRSDVREALAGLGYRPTRSATPPPSCPTTATPSRSCARPSARLATARRGVAPCARSCSIPSPEPDEAAAESASAARGAWPSSSARPSSRPTSRSSSRPPAGGARPPTTCCSPARPGWARRRLAGIIATEMGAHLHVTSGPGARAGRRPGRHPHPARRGRRALHRRDPPPAPRGRGGPLPGDGGLPARHRAGQGPGGPVDPPRPAPLHPGGRHHPHRARSPAAPRPLRPRRPARLLHRRRPRGDRRAGRRHPRRGHRRRRAAPRSPAGPGARPASPTACCAGCATSPRSRATARSTGGTAERGPGRSSASTSAASTRSTGRILVGHVRALRRRARSGCPRWPSAWASRPRRSRTSTSRSSSSRACSCARPGAGWPRRRRGTTSGLAAAAAGGPTGRPPRRCSGADCQPAPLGTRCGPMDVGRLRLRPAARAPSPRRRSSPVTRARLLVDGGSGAAPEHRTSPTCPALVRPGDVVVVNTTRVLPARLRLAQGDRRRGRGAAARAAAERATWEALVRPSRQVRAGHRRCAAGDDLTRASSAGPGRATAPACVELRRAAPGGRRAGARSTATARCRCRRTSPTPLADPERYQTVYADRPGSVAAPTAGLHLTPAVLDALPGRRGAAVEAVELVVGLGTFRPIAADEVEDHHMHAERYRVPPSHAGGLRRGPGRRRPGGGRRHDHVRALESAAATGAARGPHRAVHPPAAGARGGRRAAHQLPPAPLVAARAGRRLRRAPVARPLRRGAGRRLPLPVASATPCSSTGRAADDAPMERSTFAVEATVRRGPRRHGHAPPGARSARRASCRSAPGARCAPVVGRPRGPRRRDRARQHLPPDAAARRRRGRPRSAGCTASPTGAGHVLTDSGGYQVFSLEPEGRRRRRDVPLDLRRQHATASPPRARSTSRSALGGDIQMVLDVCPPLPSPRRGAARRGRPHRAVGRAGPRGVPGATSGPTSASSASCRAAPTSRCGPRAPSGPSRSGFDGYAIGGLSVGEAASAMLPALAAALAELPGRPAPLPHGPRRPGRASSRPWPWASTCSTACCPPGSPATARSSPSAGPAQPAQPAASPTTPARSTRPAAARCAPAGRGPTCATCCRWTSRPRPGLLTLHNVAWTFASSTASGPAIAGGHARRAAGRGGRSAGADRAGPRRPDGESPAARRLTSTGCLWSR